MSATDILVTAFEPFGGDSMNPTEAALRALPERVAGMSIKKLLLPVEFGRSFKICAAEFDRVSPAALIMLGQAGGRDAITPEAVGRNLMDARIPDNAGFDPKNSPIIPGGEAELFSTLPVADIAERMNGLGIPARVSHDAGLYVCNSLLYSMLAHVKGSVPAGFIHVPFVREQVEGVPGRENAPFMEHETIAAAILAAIETTARSL